MKKNLLLTTLVVSSSLVLALQASPVFADENEGSVPVPSEDVKPVDSNIDDSVVEAPDENSQTPSVKVTVRYSNGLPLAEGSEVSLKNGDKVITKKVDANGVVTFGEADGLVKGTSYEISGSNIQDGSTVNFAEKGISEVTVSADLPGFELPLVIKVKVKYTNGLPVEEGTEVRLRNLTAGSSEVFKKTADKDGMVTFTEDEGIKKGVSYSLETDGNHKGKTIRYALGGEREQSLTLDLPGAEKPLTLKVIAVDKDGKPVKAGTEIHLRNNKDASAPIIVKTLNDKGEVVFTEADGLNKEVGYSIEAEGITTGYTIRYDLGGDKEIKVVFGEVKNDGSTGTAVSGNIDAKPEVDNTTDGSAQEDKNEEGKVDEKEVTATETNKDIDKKVADENKQAPKRAELPKTGVFATGLSLGLMSLVSGAAIFKKNA